MAKTKLDKRTQLDVITALSPSDVGKFHGELGVEFALYSEQGLKREEIVDRLYRNFDLNTVEAVYGRIDNATAPT